MRKSTSVSGRNRVLLLLVLGLTGGVVAAQDWRPDDFAYGAELTVDDSSALYRAALPLDVYRYAQRKDFGDVRVFNAGDETVPHSIQPVATRTTVETEMLLLPHFPIYTESGQSLGNLSLRVQTNANGTILSLNGQPAATGTSRQISAYLIDASGVSDPLRALEIQWQAAPESYSGSVTLTASKDLGSWKTIAANAPLAALRYQGQTLEQRIIEFAPRRAKYLRLTWPDAALPEITGINATTAIRVTDAPREWLNSEGRKAKNNSGSYDFDLTARVPVDRLQIELPERNTLVQASWLTRESEQDKWHAVASGVLYRLNTENGEIRNPPLTIAPRKNRYWRLQVNQIGGGLGSGLPAVRVGWIPDQLVFVARGEGPFTLAYGATAVAAGGVPIAQLLPDYRVDGELDARLATVGTKRELGGEIKLQPAAPPVPWKTYLLWAVLAIGVVLLGLMATRLLRQINGATPAD